MVEGFGTWVRDWTALVRVRASVATGALFVAGAWPRETGHLIVGGGSYGLCMAAVNSFNDFCDVQTDIVNQRNDRPLTRMRLRRTDALYTALGLGGLGSALAATVNELAFSTTFLLLGWIYSRYSRRLPFVPHVIVAAALCLVFVAGRVSSHQARGGMQIVVETVSLGCFCLLYEFSQSTRDVAGDEQVGYVSVVRLVGPAALKWIYRGVGIVAIAGFWASGLLFHTSHWYYVCMVGAVAVWFLSTPNVARMRPAWAVQAVRILGLAALVMN